MISLRNIKDVATRPREMREIVIIIKIKICVQIRSVYIHVVLENAITNINIGITSSNSYSVINRHRYMWLT